MKNILSLVAIILFSLNSFAQQNPTYKIEYRFVVDPKLMELSEEDLNESQKVLLAAVMMIQVFQEDDKPLAEVWGNKEFVKAQSNLSSNQFELTDKKNNIQYLVYPASTQYYKNERPENVPLALAEELENSDNELPFEFTDQTKEIAGYTCKLAKMIFEEEEAPNTPITLEVWYTEKLPSVYWGEYYYLKNIPGAALEITTMGIGISADKVAIDNSPNLFDIPDHYTQIESPLERDFLSMDPTADKEKEYFLADNRTAFLDEEKDLYGIKDSEGKIVLAPQFSYIQTFEDDMAVVIDENSYYGLIDINGKSIISPKYESLTYNPQDKTLAFILDDKAGIMNLQGKILIPNEYEYINFFSDEGRAIATKDGKYGVIDLQNKTVVPFQYPAIVEIVENRFIVSEEDDSYSLYSLEGDKKASFDYIMYAKEKEIFIVIQNEKYGFINADGKVIIPLQYEYATPFEKGLAEVYKQGAENSVFINTKGEIVQK